PRPPARRVPAARSRTRFRGRPRSQLAAVNDPAGAVLEAGQDAGSEHGDDSLDAGRVPDPLTRRALELVDVATVARLIENLQRVQLFCLAVDDELVVAGQAFERQEDRLDLAREDVAAVQQEQVVGATAHLADAARAVPAAARLVDEHAAVAGAVAEHRRRLPAQAR